MTNVLMKNQSYLVFGIKIYQFKYINIEYIKSVSTNPYLIFVHF